MPNPILIQTLVLIYSSHCTLLIAIVFGAHFVGIVVSLVLGLTSINRSYIVLVYLFAHNACNVYVMVFTSIRCFEDNLRPIFGITLDI
jgi:hypothetical protein